MFRKSLTIIVLRSLLSSCYLLLATSIAAATTVTARNGNQMLPGLGQPPLDIFGIVPTGTFYFFDAHPREIGLDIGFKSLQSQYSDVAIFGINEIHTTIGTGTASSFLLKAGGNLLFRSEVVANINPGPAEMLPVSMTVALSDPLTIGPEFTNFSTLNLDVFLASGTKFDGIPNIPTIADNPKISLDGRVTPGEISNPIGFFDDSITDAIDLYQIEIEQSNSSGLIETVVNLGTSNSLFSLSFSDSEDVIEQRIVNALIGDAGNYEVLSDQFLFSLTLEPTQENLVYTFGDRLEAIAPDVETTPEDTSILSLLALSTLGMWSVLKKNRQYLTEHSVQK